MGRSRAAIVLAAGKGTRMKSALPKVLHGVGGRTMLDWALSLAKDCGCDRIVVVYGAHAPEVGDAAKNAGATAILQDPPLGTGHAVAAAKDALADFEGDLVVLYADTPLVQADTVRRAFAALESGADIAVLGFDTQQPGAYGRLIVEDGVLKRIVEAKDTNDAERTVTLCNSGVMAGDARTMFGFVSRLNNDNAKSEYYLTDVVAMADRAAAVMGEAAEFAGVNDRLELAAAEARFQARMRREALLNGVAMAAPETVVFHHDTRIEEGAVVEPYVVFGPGVRVAAGAVIHSFSHLEGASLDAGASAGPFARLRPGADLAAKAKVGNFVEIKQASIGAGAKVSHLTYLGDAEVGAGANIGAGTITCNYDGFRKHRTVIGEGAFIGSNSALVAPVTIGDGAYIGSGSVVTQDVAPDALALARARQEAKPGWAARFRERMKKEKR